MSEDVGRGLDIRLIGFGVTRHVILAGPWAIKLPRVNYGWRLFLVGLLANIQERELWTTRDDRLCPVVWSLAGGWLVIQRRARLMTAAEFERFDWIDFVTPGEGRTHLPAECKSDSFGWLDGRVVAVDYGS